MSALGLPTLRQWNRHETAGSMLYGGDVCVFEVNRSGQPPVSDPSVAECTQIFRVRDLDAVVEQVLSVGASSAVQETIHNVRTVFLRDSVGHLYGLRQAHDDSPLAQNLEAARSWNAGARGLAGLPSLPSSIQNLGYVRLRVEDPDAMATFYAEMLGLDVLPSSADGVV